MKNDERNKGQEKLRKTGIDVIGDTPWGAHICQFYQTKEDLINVLVPYFKAGLENNEFCMWVTSEPLGIDEANTALKKAVKGLGDYIKRGQIEILDYTQWYTKSGKFEADKVLQGWIEKEKQAIGKGFEGLRLTGNTFWLETRDWRKFAEYEAIVNNVIGKRRMLAICTYSLDRCGVSEIVDVIENHQRALIRRREKWVVIESPHYKKTEEALFRDEIVLNMSEGVYVIRASDGVIIYTNPKLEEMFGYGKEEMIGKHVSIVNAPTDVAPVETVREIMKHLKENRKWHGEINNIRKDGTSFWCFANVSVFKHPRYGDVWVSVHTDITKRKKVEEDLKKSREVLKEQARRLEGSLKEALKSREVLVSMLEDNSQIREDLEKSKDSLTEAQRIAHCGSWDWNFRSNELRWSDEIYRIFGLTPYQFDITYELFLNSIHPDDRDFVNKSINEALSKGKPYSIDHRIVLPDGEVRVVHQHGEVILSDSKKPIRMFGTVQDISESKLLEQQLIQSEKLAAVGELISGVAHEINNPLTAVVGFAELLEKHKNGLGKDQQKQLEIICSEAEKVRTIVSKLLSFARKTKSKKEAVSVNTLVGTVLDIRGYELRVNNINVVKKFGEELPQVKVDAQQIEQVFLNIVNNAEQAMIRAHGKGNLTIRTYTSDGLVRIEFIDDGPGIPKKNLKKIFDPFFTTKEVGKGTGLGLSVSYGIINENNGNIFAESEEGKGTTFIVELPFVGGDPDEKRENPHN